MYLKITFKYLKVTLKYLQMTTLDKYVRMYLISNLLFSILGDKSTNPNEACMNYYFDAENSPIITLVSEGGHNTRPCPFSGRYTLTGAPHTGAMSALMSGQLNCHQAIMHAGCSASDDLIVESVCSRNLEDNVR